MTEPATPADRCVLVVDDDPSMQRFLEVVLRRAGFDVKAAGTGRRALALLHPSPPVSSRVTAVLLDAMLPDTRGYDLARRIVDDPATAGLPICFLTGAIQGRLPIEGGIACIVKPTTPKEIVATLEVLIAAPATGNDAVRRRAIDAVEALSLL